MDGPSRLSRAFAGVALAAAVAGCGLIGSTAPSGPSMPEPTCGGAKIVIPGALGCEELAEIALRTLRTEAPGQLERGVIGVTVDLQGCPRNEVPPQLDCTGEDFVQLVTVTFGPSAPGGPLEASLSVGVAPVSGRVLGIVNPLIK